MCDRLDQKMMFMDDGLMESSVPHCFKFTGEGLTTLFNLRWRALVVEDSIRSLAQRNFSYKEMARLLQQTHGVNLTANAVGKRLKRLRFPSRKGPIVHNDADVKRAIEVMLHDLPQTAGYRYITNRLRQNGLHVRRDAVMKLLRDIDPLGVEFRRRRRIRRRVYRSAGPNHIWHVDGYDKLKPFGVAIHGCIDGYSRRIMWLRVGPSNNDPKIVAFNYVSCIQSVKGCPLILQADPGTENGTMGAMQCVLRHGADDCFSGYNSFRVTRSVFNQRIEAWWSMFRRRQSEWWIYFFRDLEGFGRLHRGNEIEMFCLRYCFIPLIQRELNTVADEWNSHHVSPSRSAVCPNGRPDVLYSLSHDTGGIDCLQSISVDDIQWAISQCKLTSLSGSEEFYIFAEESFRRNGWTCASTWQDALENYSNLLNSCL